MAALYYLKKALSLPPHIVIQKAIRKIRKSYQFRKKKWIDRYFSTYELNRASYKIHRFVQKIDLELLPKKDISEGNDHFLKHEFDLLGSGWVRVFHGMQCKGIERTIYPPKMRGFVNLANREESKRIQEMISPSYEPIDWHIDFKSGYRWEEDVCSEEIRYGSDYGADVKVPWELSRMQHLIHLAWGYALHLDEKYVVEFQNQILDFIASNPPRYGVNWACTMDVGIRIANWLLAYDLFRAYEASFDPEFEKLFSRSVYEHGKHIFHHLEWDPYLRSNHYLANIAGLLFVSSYLQIDSWFEFSIQELKKEMLLQFNPDGSNFEASTNYHRLSLEMVIYSTALALEKGVEFSKEYLERFQKMIDFIRDVTKPDGTLVQIGDNDSGRFIKLFPNARLIPAFCKNLTSLIASQMMKDEKKRSSFVSYPDFGLFIQKKDPWFLAARCGSIGQKGNGGHAHNDQLSFELSINEISMIIDPGTYVYTPVPEQRRRFRSTSMHNTLAIQGKEQNEDLGLFSMKDCSQAKLILFEDGLFIAEHFGFGIKHRRTIKIEGAVLEGIDEGPLGWIYFHFDPRWTGRKIHETKTEWSCSLFKVSISADCGNMNIIQSEFSKAYGEKEKAFALVIETNSKSTSWKIQV